MIWHIIFDKRIEKDYKTVVFQIWKYWMDIGNKINFETAGGECGEIFRGYFYERSKLLFKESV